MERKYPHLCKPIRIGNVWYRNRMFSTPMGGTDIELDGCNDVYIFAPDGSLASYLCTQENGFVFVETFR